MGVIKSRFVESKFAVVLFRAAFEEASFSTSLELTILILSFFDSRLSTLNISLDQNNAFFQNFSIFVLKSVKAYCGDVYNTKYLCIETLEF